MANNEQHSGTPLGSDTYLGRINQGRLPSRESTEFFEVGYGSVDSVFDPNRGTLDNVTAALRERAGQGDHYASNQGGFVLGVLARVEELSGGQQQ